MVMIEKYKKLFEAVYYGTDLEFKYGSNYFFISSGRLNDSNVDKHSITVFKSKESFYEGKNAEESIVIYSSTNENYNDNVNDLFEAKIFGGKTFCEIVDFITEISY